jgi:hypothetical protein
MAHYRTTPLSRARHELAVLKCLLGLVLLVVSSVALTFPANAPGMAGEVHLASAEPTATIARVGSDVIITGSIDLFGGASFTGTNRALKQDRARPQVDLVAMTAGFDDIRARIAALRNPELAPGPVEMPAAAASERIEVASLQDPASSAALDAIDALAPGEAAPVPLTMSKELAYAREDLPATTFDGSVLDKQGKKVSDKELWCMASAIYFEARGESYRGQVAVGQVVMNRVAHRLYPDTICAVVFQNQSKRNACQISFACDGIPEKVTKIGMHVFYQFKRGWKYG